MTQLFWLFLPLVIASGPFVFPTQAQSNLDLYILAGQSNMSGRGEVPPIQLVNDNILVFGNDYQWSIAQEPIDNWQGQVDQISMDVGAGVGPGLAFAQQMAEPGRYIGLIPCAYGGSSIEDWQRDLSTDSLYGSCLNRIRIAQAYGGEVKGLLFLQGETDAQHPYYWTNGPLHAEDWHVYFMQMVSDFRADLEVPCLPVVFGQIGAITEPAYVNLELVQQSQVQVDMAGVRMIDTYDLPLQDDGVHFTTASYRVIGWRFAEAIKKPR